MVAAMTLLILGGTTEGLALARAFAARGVPAIHSLAGRTATPQTGGLPSRIGGFGGVAGLAAFLRDHGIAQVVDATHPFAARISRNAVAACAETGVPLLALERPGWRAGPGDRWTRVPDLAAAAAALPEDPARVFLAIGRQHLAAFAGRPEHWYLLRLVDPPAAPLPLPRALAVVDRGPFDAAADAALLAAHRIGLVVARDAGGDGARGKLDAARARGLPVILIDRPALPPRETVPTPEAVLARLHARLGV
jgi:precorrin-6A/cobalt-precorrin-6A reductase